MGLWLKNKDTCLKLTLFVARANKMVQNLWEVWILAFDDSLDVGLKKWVFSVSQNFDLGGI